MRVSIRILEGIPAKQELQDPSFISNWEEIYNESESKTFFQSSNFVIPWYSIYSDEFSPIIVMGFYDTVLVGLLFLAKSRVDNIISHAGSHQAEYHGWIAKKKHENEFLISALVMVKKTYKIKKWTWRWLPRDANTEWVKSNQLILNGILNKVMPNKSPLYVLNNLEKLNKIKKKSNIKNLINRYNKYGEFYLERVVNIERAKELIDEVVKQYNYRQALKNDIVPFEQDKQKKNFYLSKMDFPENVHFTVLWSNNRLIASHIGDCDRKTVYYGLPTFHPMESRNSPGTLLLIKLVEKLIEEKYQFLDLTPGMDSNKEKFANSYSNVIRPTFYFNRFEFLKDSFYYWIKGLVKYLAKQIRLNPAMINRIVAKIKMKLKTFSKSSFSTKIENFYSLFYQKRHYILYKFNFDNRIKLPQIEQDLVRIQQYSDLLLYIESIPYQSRSDLLNLSQMSFDNNAILFTIIKNNKLAHFSWAVKNNTKHFLSEVGLEFIAPPVNVVFYNSYTEPIYRNQGLHLKSLSFRVQKFIKEGIDNIYVGVHHNNLQSRKNIEKVGFAPEKEYKQKVYFRRIIKNIN